MKRYIVVTILAATSAASIATGQWVDRRFWLPDSFPDYSNSSYVVQNRTSGRMYLGGRFGSREGLHIFDPGTGRKYGFQDSVDECPAIVHCPGVGRVWASVWSGSTRSWLYGFDDVADTLVSAVPAGEHWWLRLCYNPARNELYGVDEDNGGLYLLDPLTCQIRDSVMLVEGANRLVWDSRHNYLFCVASWGDSGVESIDCSTFTSLGMTPGTAHTTDLALHPSEPKLYCIAYDDAASREVMRVVNTDLVAVTDSIVLPLSEDWFYDGRIDICRRTNRLYCRFVYEGDGQRVPRFHTFDTLVIFDISADTVIRALGLPDRDDEPRRIACNEVTGKVYIGYVNMAYTVVIDQGDSIRARLPFGWADDLCWDSLHNRLYIGTDQPRLEVAVLDGNTDSVVAREDYHGVRPQRMFWSARSDRMYVMDWPGVGWVGYDSLDFWMPFHYVTSAVSAYCTEANRLYALADTGDGQYMFVYDCNTDSILRGIRLDGGVDIALVPEVHKVYIRCADTTRIYDVLTDSMVGMRTGFPPRFLYNPKSSRAYYSYGTAVAVLDLIRDTIERVVEFERPVSVAAVDTASNELWLGAGAPGQQFLAVDCGTMQVVDSVFYGIAGFHVMRSPTSRKVYAFNDSDSVVVVSTRERRVVKRLGFGGRVIPWLYDSRSDRLYLSRWSDSVLILYCRTDSVVARVEISGSSSSWPCFAAGPTGEVWIAKDKSVTVIRDTAAAVTDPRRADPPYRAQPTILRGELSLSRSLHLSIPPVLLDVSGRKVLDLLPGPNDVRSLAPGIYFVRAPSAASRELSAVTKVVIAR